MPLNYKETLFSPQSLYYKYVFCLYCFCCKPLPSTFSIFVDRFLKHCPILTRSSQDTEAIQSNLRCSELADETCFDFSAVSVMQYLMLTKLRSAGLGGLFGVSQTLWLGNEKKITHNKFHLVIFLLVLTFKRDDYGLSTFCLSLILSLQSSNEVYKNIKHPYRRIQPAVNDNSKFTIFCIFCLASAVSASL